MASHDSAVVTVGSCDSGVVAAVAGAPATRAAAYRLLPSITFGWMSVNDVIFGKFSNYFLLS